MTHPVVLLKRYLTELNERIVDLDAKSDVGMRTINERISKLDVKLDGSVQSTNESLNKLDSKLDGGMRTMSETLSKLDVKLDGSVQSTNQTIGDLYRDKLSVQEFREFVNVFNKILGESLPLSEEPVKEEPIKIEPIEDVAVKEISANEEPEKQPMEVTVQATTSGSQELPTEKTEETQNAEKKRKHWW